MGICQLYDILLFRNLFSSTVLDYKKEDVNVQDMLAYQRGDENAFLRIYHRNKTKVYGWCFRMLKNEHSAEEISQEVFLRVARSEKSYQPRAKFSTWLYTIASRLVFNEIRRIQRHPENEIDLDGWARIADLSEDWINRFDQAQRVQLVEDALSQIPQRQRAVLLLRYSQDLSYEEISEAMRISTKAVKSLLHRGLTSLSKILEGRSIDG